LYASVKQTDLPNPLSGMGSRKYGLNGSKDTLYVYLNLKYYLNVSIS
jgi:hypothetical protein